MDILVKLMFSTHPKIRIYTFLSVLRVSKFHLSPRQGITISKLAHIEISSIVTKLCVYYSKCCTMDPGLKLKFKKVFEIRIWTFLSIFSVSQCHLSPRLAIDISKLVYLVISMIVTKLSLFCLKCSTMDPWLKIKFPTLLEIRICTFLSVFSVSKFHLSPRQGIIIRKLAHIEI